MYLQANHYTQYNMLCKYLQDASIEGWGAHLGEHTARGTWSLLGSKLHINYIELKAVFLALKEFQDLCSNKIVLVATDNTTVVSLNMQQVAPAQNRLTCHEVQQQVASVCVTGTGSPGHSSGWAQSAMLGSGSIHLPTISHIGQSGEVCRTPHARESV